MTNWTFRRRVERQHQRFVPEPEPDMTGWTDMEIMAWAVKKHGLPKLVDQANALAPAERPAADDSNREAKEADPECLPRQDEEGTVPGNVRHEGEARAAHPPSGQAPRPRAKGRAKAANNLPWLSPENAPPPLSSPDPDTARRLAWASERTWWRPRDKDEDFYWQEPRGGVIHEYDPLEEE